MNTRVTVPLTKEAYDAVTLIAEIGGISRGRFLADVLEAAIPSFLTIAAAYRAAQAVEGEERAALVDAMTEAEKKLLEVMQEVAPAPSQDQADRPSPAPRQGAGSAGEGRADPPILTGGFTTVGDEGREH